MSRVFCKKWWKLNIFPYLIDFLSFLLQLLSLYVYAILLKEFRHSMVLGKSNTKVSEKYCRAPVEYADCISCKEVSPPPSCLEYVTKLHLMMRLQFWRSGECGVPQGSFWPWVVVPVKVSSMSQIDLFRNYP